MLQHVVHTCTKFSIHDVGKAGVSAETSLGMLAFTGIFTES